VVGRDAATHHPHPHLSEEGSQFQSSCACRQWRPEAMKMREAPWSAARRGGPPSNPLRQGGSLLPHSKVPSAQAFSELCEIPRACRTPRNGRGPRRPCVAQHTSLGGLDTLVHKAYTIIGGRPSGQGAKASSCQRAIVPCNLEETF